MHDNRRSAETHRTIKGRMWRVSDPALEDDIRQHLVDELMDARRAVKSALGTDDDTQLAAARVRVQDAKVALGERGPKWWEPTTSDEDDVRIAAFIRAMGDRLATLDEQSARAHLRLTETEPTQS